MIPFYTLGVYKNKGEDKQCLEEIIIAGFGGQGVMSMGQIIAYAGMLEGKVYLGCHLTVLNNVGERPIVQLL